MSKYKNLEVFKIAGDKTVTVSVTFNVDEKANDTVILKDAAEALKFFANSNLRQFSAWVKEINVRNN